MARPLKVYTLGNHGFIRREVNEALSIAPHIRQASVLAVATSKAHAVQVYAEHGFTGVRPGDQEFRVAMGRDLDALAEAGLLTEPGVWVMPLVGTRSSAVVRMQPGGTPQRVGRLESGDNYRSTFIPEDSP